MQLARLLAWPLTLAFGYSLAAGCGANQLFGTPGAGGSGGVAAVNGAGAATSGSPSSGSPASTGSPASSSSTGSGGCMSAGDCPAPKTSCTPAVCTAGKCTTTNAMQGTACSDSGGKVCDGMGKCVACTMDGDCAKPDVCSSMHTCVPPTCMDGKKDGTETDIDCGGMCPPCANSKKCLVAGDCQSGFCDANTCAPCGGDPDCAGIANTYCDNGSCAPQKKDGDACGGANECTSGFCTQSVCCDKDCGAKCQSCLAKDTGGADGTCDAVTKGTDPNNDCAMQAQSTCGVSGTGCNGDAANPGCIDWAAGTQCIAPACLDANTETLAGSCDGGGKCVPGMNMPCAPYVCKGGACLKACMTDGDCQMGNYCNAANACVPQLANGKMCSATNQCTSSNCVDGVCCDMACAGACDACLMALGAPADGMCGTMVVKNAQNPMDCDANTVAGNCQGAPCSCNGSAVCLGDLGAKCTMTSQCNSGHCVDGVCCNNGCTGSCQGCLMALTGQPNGTCGNVAGMANPKDCDANTVAGGCKGTPCTCSAGSNCLGAAGAPCGGNGDCASNNCKMNACK